MKNASIAVVVLAALACGVWFLLRAPSPAFSESVADKQLAKGSGAPTQQLDSTLAGDSPGDAAARESGRIATSDPPRAEDPTLSPRAHVFGELVGEDDTPLVGVRAWLMSVTGEWAKGVDVPTVEIRGRPSRAFETRSNDAGRFEFDVPVPTSDWVMFFFEPDEFHAFDTRNFGPAGGRDEARLIAGDDDLGTFRLATTGTVEGVVHASDGKPVANAEISIHDAMPRALVIHCRSGTDGKYVLAHVPEGTFTLRLNSDGYLLQERGSVSVRKRERTGGVDFVLEHAPTIEGIVVDTTGAPVSDVEVEAWPLGGGREANARSRTDGRFTMYLPQQGAYSFDFDAQGYEHFGGIGTAKYEPGARDVRLTLKRAEQVEVSVVDNDTGAPVERFGIAICLVEASGWQRTEALDEPAVEQHPRGRVTLTHESGKEMARVLAPGYASVSAALDVPNGAREARPIRLVRAASISARVVIAGSPRSGVQIELKAASIKRDPSQPDEPEEERVFSDNYTSDVNGFAGRPRKVATDEEGRFRFGDLIGGHYTLAVRTAATAPYVVDSIALDSKQVLDLGDITLRAGAAIRGRIISASARESDSWVVMLDRDNAVVHATVGSNGSFHFDGVAPGHHILLVKHQRMPIEPVPAIEVDVGEGETKDVVLDVASLCPARVRVRVVQGGRPMEGVRVRAYCDALQQEIPIGTQTDAQGEVSGECAPCSAARFAAYSALDLQLGERADVAQIQAGASVDVELALASGRARLEFPAAYVIPPRASAFAWILASNAKRAGGFLTFGTVDSLMTTHLLWKDRVVDIGDVAPGEYSVTVRVQQQREAAGATTEVVAGFTGTFRVEPNQSAVCALAPEENPK